MKKKIFALLSALCLTAGCLGACGVNESKYTLPTATPTAEPTAVPEATKAPEATATTAPTTAPAVIIATTVPEATKAPETTTAPETTKAPEATKAPASKGLTYDFNDLTYNSSYGTNYTIESDGSISLQYDGQYQEIKLALPEEIDMSSCKKVTVKFDSDYANISFKLYDTDFKEVFVHYNMITTGSAEELELYPELSTKVAGIGIMAQDIADDYSSYVATVYSVSFDVEGGSKAPAATATPAPTKTPAATATPVPTKAPAATTTPSKAADLTYDFNDFSYNSSYGTSYKVGSDGSIAIQYDGQYQEIKLDIPKVLDMSYCTGITIKMKSEQGPLAFKLYDEDYSEVFVQYNLTTSGVDSLELYPELSKKVAGIGIMANEATAKEATVYSVTFHMKAGYDSGKAAPTPTPIPTDPNDTGIWENNADISWIDTSKPMIAFTFDDGPVGTSDSASSIRIQNALAASGQHATFFYWGNKINSGNSAEIKRAYEMGFEIGNHTYSHPNLTSLTAEKILENVTKCADKLTEITGLEHFLVRPPYLATNSTVKATVREPMINCSIDSKDWDGATTEQIINNVYNNKKDGAIVLMHETYNTTAEAMETLIPQLVSEGWQIVSVSELFKAKGQELLDGSVYNNAK